MTQEKKQPSHDVFVVTGEGKDAYWTKVGAAWENRDGLGYNLQLSALPLDGKLTMRFIKEKDDDKKDKPDPRDDPRYGQSDYRSRTQGK
jgi:hypothetical protein